MASLTFDEFHAIRSRQRAAEAADSRSRASASSAPDERGRGRKSSAQASFAGHSPTVKGRNEGAEVAPPSGSTRLRFASRGQRESKTGTSTGDDKGSTSNAREGAAVTTGVGRGSSARWSALRASSLGYFVELFEVQVAVVALIYLDLVASTAQLLPCFQLTPLGTEPGVNKGDSRMVNQVPWALRVIARLVQSFTGFTTILFAIEVVLLLAAFRRRFFRHFGYVLDLAVVSACLWQELTGMGRGLRLLGAARVWRVVRIMNTLLLSADESHAETRMELRSALKRAEDIDTDRTRLQETIRREIEARKSVDKMLRGYKDEVETLNEALKIAAMDIAAAGVTSPGNAAGTDDSSSVASSEIHDRPADITSAGSKADGLDSRTSSSAAGAENRGGGQGQGRVSSPPPSKSSDGRIYVLQDGSFRTR